MLTQIHHQYRDERKSDFIAQKDIDNRKDLRRWIQEVKSNPENALPEDALWMVCHEGSPYFLMTTADPVDLHPGDGD